MTGKPRASPEVARNFPRTGPWPEVVKQMLGFLLLATAVYFARPFFQHLLSDEFFYWSLFAVLAGGAVQTGFDRLYRYLVRQLSLS